VIDKPVIETIVNLIRKKQMRSEIKIKISSVKVLVLYCQCERHSVALYYLVKGDEIGRGIKNRKETKEKRRKEKIRKEKKTAKFISKN